MDINTQFDKAQLEINQGLKEKAANRLKNLINVYPDCIEAREMLALMYYKSGFLDMAGKYWFLTDPTQEPIRKSIEVYQQSVNNSPIQILKDLKYRGDKSGLPEYTRDKLIALEDEVKNIKLRKPKKYSKPAQHKPTLKGNVLNIVFKITLLLVVLFIIVGAIASVTWVISLF